MTLLAWFRKRLGREKDYPWSHSVGEGWQTQLVDPFLEVAEKFPEIHILQIKEKFGTLRIYIAGPEWAQNLADALEIASETCCEDCGRKDGWQKAGENEAAAVKNTPGKYGWWKTLCQYCRADREKDK